MRKKLTAQGPTNRKSFTVTLPLEWVKSHKLHKSREVELNLVKDTITISPIEKKEAVRHIKGEEYTSLVKVIQQLYRKGTNEIKIDFSTGTQLKSILQLINSKLIGYEIISQNKTTIIIRDITKESQEDFSTILRRVFLLLLELIESKEPDQQEILAANISKFTNYAQRILIKKGHTEYEKVPTYYLILDRLEKLKDEVSWLQFSKKKSQKELKEVQSMLRNVYELFYSYNTKKFVEITDITYSKRKKYIFSEKTKSKIIYLHNITRILNSLCGDIFSLHN